MNMLVLSFLKGFICSARLQYTVVKRQFEGTDAEFSGAFNFRFVPTGDWEETAP